MPRRIIRVFQLWSCRQVAFKLYPVEPLNAFLRICIDEGMQFAIRHAVEHPAVRANVLRGVRHTDSYRGIAFRSDHVAFHLALRTGCLGWEESTKENDGYALFEQASPRIVVGLFR